MALKNIFYSYVRMYARTYVNLETIVVIGYPKQVSCTSRPDNKGVLTIQVS